jgi:hypothetical protein
MTETPRSDCLWRTNDRVGTCSWRSDLHSERVRHHGDGAPAGASQLLWAACRPMAVFGRPAPVVRSYHVFHCIHHRRTRTAVVAHVAPAPLVATMPWGDIGVTKFTSGSLTIRGGSAVPGSAFYQRDTHISRKASTARQRWNGTPQLEPKPK